MGVLTADGSVPSLPPPRPPEYPDFNGKRRELTKVEMLEKEICFLEVVGSADLRVTMYLWESAENGDIIFWVMNEYGKEKYQIERTTISDITTQYPLYSRPYLEQCNFPELTYATGALRSTHNCRHLDRVYC